MNPEEEFFLQQLKELGIKDIQPRFTPQGIEFEALTRLQTYYEPGEMIKLMDSLTAKGLIEKINYGTVGLCPSCSSPVFMLTLACPRCGSLKVSKKELVKHVECGHSGYSDEFVVGIHYVCPSCGAKARIAGEDGKSDEEFKVSDALYECEDCRSISANALTSFNCIKCKTRFSSKEIRYENPCGYRLSDSLASQERAKEAQSSGTDEAALEEIGEQAVFEAEAEPEETEGEETPPITEIEEPLPADETEESEELEALAQQEPGVVIDVEDAAPIEAAEPDEALLEPQEEPSEEPEEPSTEKRGFFGRIFSKKAEPQIAPKPAKPIKIEKEVVKRNEATILLIEQDQYRADRIIKNLERTRLQSIEVKHAPSGKLGLRELREPYDAVILDMCLGDLNPDIIVREISRWRITTPLIVITDDEASAKILSRVDLSEVKVLEYSEAAVRQLPGMIEKLIS